MWLLKSLFLLVSTFSLTQALCAEWDHLTYARQWPQATCLSNQRSHMHPCCSIPSNVSDWTIHGVWPSKGTEKGPVGCNCSTSFDPNKVKPIENALKKEWPTLYPGVLDSMHKFWQHEWDKHGRCGVDIESMKDELHYFQTGMELNRRYNLDQVFRRSGITPSDTATYPINRIMTSLSHGFGAMPIIACVHDKVLGKQYVTQIELCLSRSFKPVSCPEGVGVKNYTEHCLLNMPISIPVIQSGKEFPDGCSKNDSTLYFLPTQ